MVKKDEPKQETIEEPHSDLIENQIDFFSFAQDSTQVETEETPAPILETEETISQQEETTKVEETELKDDAKFLDKSEQFELTPFQEAQNKILYDTSSELKKYRKKKSFSENQIEMAVVYEREEDKLHQKEQIEQLKQSLFNARQKGLDEISQEKTNQEDEIEFEKEIASNNFEEEKDDAVFITTPRIHVEN
ncbi:MAG: hypothetical protein E7375_04135, partial [Clostridiales bacterium]|nr:hypothetical protein [Clostridiales bacterium]